jgi:hypothetical protein
MEPINTNLGNDIWNLPWGGEGKYSTKRYMKVYLNFLRLRALSNGSGKHVAYPNKNSSFGYFFWID